MSGKAKVLKAVEFVLGLGSDPKDDDRLVMQKRFLLALGSLMALGGLGWGALCIAFDLHVPGIIPFSYSLLTLVNFYYFHHTKNFPLVRFFQVLMSLLLPFMLQYSLGGFYPSGAVMYWAMLSVLGSFAFANSRKNFIWILFFIALTVFGSFLEPRLGPISLAHKIPETARPWIFALNMSIVSFITFFLVFYFVRLQESAHEKIRTAERILIHSSKMAALGEMAAGMAHEINNPLAIIVSRVTVVEKMIRDEKVAPEKSVEQLDKIRETSNRIARIIHTLQALARDSQSDPMELVPLNGIISDTVELCNERFENQQIDLQVLPFNSVTVRARPGQIVQVLLNLLNNSFDAVELQKEKWVRVEVEVTEKEKIKVSIIDSGPQIANSVVEKLMQPFFTTKEVGKGTGLGLTISKQIAESNGGSLSFDRNYPHTRFVLELNASATESTFAA